MEILLILLTLPVAVTAIAAALIWKWRGTSRPIASGAAIFGISLIPAFLGLILLEGLGQLGLGIFVLIPMLLVLTLGTGFLVAGIVKGRRQAAENLKKVARIVLDDPHR